MTEAPDEANDETWHLVWFEIAQQWVKLAGAYENTNPFQALIDELERLKD